MVERSSRNGREMVEKWMRNGREVVKENGREIGERMIEKSVRKWPRNRRENDRENGREMVERGLLFDKGSIPGRGFTVLLRCFGLFFLGFCLFFAAVVVFCVWVFWRVLSGRSYFDFSNFLFACVHGINSIPLISACLFFPHTSSLLSARLE